MGNTENVIKKSLSQAAPEIQSLLKEVFSFDTVLCVEIMRLKNSGVEVHLNDETMRQVKETIKIAKNGH